MSSNELEIIIEELAKAESNLKSQVEKLYGKIETTDFSDEYAELQDVLARLKALTGKSERPVELPPAS